VEECVRRLFNNEGPYKTPLRHARAIRWKTEEAAYHVFYSVKGPGSNGEEPNQTYDYTVTTYYTIEITVGEDTPRGGLEKEYSGDYGDVLSISFNTYEQPDQVSVLQDGAYVGGTEGSDGVNQPVATKRDLRRVTAGPNKGQDLPSVDAELDPRAQEGIVSLAINDEDHVDGEGEVTIRIKTPKIYHPLNTAPAPNKNQYFSWRSKSKLTVTIKSIKVEKKTSSQPRNDKIRHKEINKELQGG
jgi:hypothetical protein